MNVNELIGYILLVLAGVAVGIAFCAMLVQCVQNCRFLRAYRRDVTQRVNGLRLHKMLGCLGMSTKGYVRKALSSETEMHLNRCQQCATTTECDAALAKGDTSQAAAYCPNFPDLVQLSQQEFGGRDLRNAKANGRSRPKDAFTTFIVKRGA
ncbi:MAG: DUF6455 family protein [Pseudomonadota bacterium]|nr:DUF6455 family protein [Pseudomonadota bacterium]